jgi:GNAT superfamily N-acetyltransferase
MTPLRPRGATLPVHLALTIAPYQPVDREPLLAFLRAAFAHLGRTFDPATKDADLLDIAAHYPPPAGLFLLAHHASEVIATIALRPLSREVGELKRFYVHKDHQRQGVGSALLTQAVAHARTKPWHALRLDTARGSPAAALFLKHDFAEIPRYNTDPYADLFLELPLA